MVDKSRNKRVSDTTIHIKATEDTVNTFDYLMHSENLTKKDLFAKMVSLYLSVSRDRYQLPDLTLQRLNQIITALNTLSDEVHLNTKVTSNGFSTLLDYDTDESEQE